MFFYGAMLCYTVIPTVIQITDTDGMVLSRFTSRGCANSILLLSSMRLDQENQISKCGKLMVVYLDTLDVGMVVYMKSGLDISYILAGTSSNVFCYSASVCC